MIQLQRLSDDFEYQSLAFLYMTISTPDSANDGTMAAVVLLIVEDRFVDMIKPQPIDDVNDTLVEVS
ncbi:unnamed protein product [Rotaria sp. Silwood2]|nr:unnamed protein product [Rotaria sp. Silwood2]CAF3377875.1 unnamed protein product [Rotaria sp. Silwood2]CAF4250169.1 unnamed protein product [Rotaria sp. Silwood2]CAF4675421.1 unnamed protein product [Rotaria sp. Silwood2]